MQDLIEEVENIMTLERMQVSYTRWICLEVHKQNLKGVLEALDNNTWEISDDT